MRIGESRCHQYRRPAAAKRQVLEHVHARGAAARRRTSPGRARATSRRRRRRRRTRGARTARRRARSAWIRRVAGRRIHFVSPSVRQIGARSAISRCWTMCTDASCSPSASIGEISARNRQKTPVHQSTSRPSAPPARRPRRARSASARRRSTTYATSARSTMGANVHPASTGTAVGRRTRRRIVTNACCSVVQRRETHRSAHAPRSPRSSSRSIAPPGCVVVPGADRGRASGCARRARGRCRGCAAPARAARCRRTAAAACPAAAPRSPRAWAPMAYEGVARDLVARAEVPRRAAESRT